jgi:hypothetical protein
MKFHQVMAILFLFEFILFERETWVKKQKIVSKTKATEIKCSRTLNGY